jgi:drug/metabolite transporter (DMT)-like permease
MSGSGPAGPRREHARAVLALVLAQLFFGLHYSAAKIVLEEITPRAWAPLRAGSASVVLLVCTRAAGRPFALSAADYGRLAAFSVLGVVINQLLFIEGVSRTTATHAAVLSAGVPVSTLLFAVLLGREELRGYKALAVVLSTAGIVFVVRPEAPTGTVPVAGDLMILVSGLSYALFLVSSKRLLSRVDPLPATAWLLMFGALGLLGLGWRELLRLDPGQVSGPAWVWAAFIVAFPTALSYLLNSYALRRLAPSTVGLFIYLQPVVGVVLAAALLGERPEPGVLVGALLIFAGVWLSVRLPGRSAHQPPSNRHLRSGLS